MDKLKYLQDRSDANKWAHPELVDFYEMMTGLPSNSELIYNFDAPWEDRKKAVDDFLEAFNAMVTADMPDSVSTDHLFVKGCPEDPELEVELVIYRPTALEGKKLPVIYSVPGGGMHVCALESAMHWKLTRLDCAVVCPRYESVFKAKYPTQLNQLHAGYKYTVDHQEELGFKKDKIVLHGQSSGTNLVLSLAHRLKRYGYRPRGCVVEASFADHRPIYPSGTITTGGCWDAICQRRSSVMYLGENNVTAFNNAEMCPMYASAEECIGLCPTFMHTEGEDAHVSTIRAYGDKLTQAGVYNETHIWAGAVHAAMCSTGDRGDYYMRARNIVDNNFLDCFKYDLRRLWQERELGE